MPRLVDGRAAGQTFGNAGMEVTQFGTESAFPGNGRLLLIAASVCVDTLHRQSGEHPARKTGRTVEQDALGIAVDFQRLAKVPQLFQIHPTDDATGAIGVLEYGSDGAVVLPYIGTDDRSGYPGHIAQTVEVVDQAIGNTADRFGLVEALAEGLAQPLPVGIAPR